MFSDSRSPVPLCAKVRYNSVHAFIEILTLFVEQATVLLQTPALLNSLLNIVTSRNWLTPTLAAMRLHAFLTQALTPGDNSLRLAQLPGVNPQEGRELLKNSNSLETVAGNLEKEGDSRASAVKKAVSKWGRIDLVDASFKGTFNVYQCVKVHVDLRIR